MDSEREAAHRSVRYRTEDVGSRAAYERRPVKRRRGPPGATRRRAPGLFRLLGEVQILRLSLLKEIGLVRSLQRIDERFACKKRRGVHGLVMPFGLFDISSLL